MSEFWKLCHSLPWFAWIPIVAIIGGCSVAIVGCITCHREKMEKLRQGIREPPEKADAGQ
ncbi:MAG: hypothetical protein ACYS14_01515 [Planctomycetota bacterium]